MMGVDFNGLRLGMQDDFNEIVHLLKQGMYNDGDLSLDYCEVSDLQTKLSLLRDRLATLMCIYTDDSSNIADQADLLTIDLIE